MIEQLPTAFLFVLGALILPVLPRGAVRALFLVAVPIVAAWQIWTTPLGTSMQVDFFGFTLELMRVDRLSRIFALVFCLAAFLGNLYAWHLRDTGQQVAALLYAGAAIGAVFAGDLITLFIYWEGTAISSVFLIWARGTQGAYHTGMRYLLIQVGSGVILLAGVILLYSETGSIAFQRMELGSLATWLIFLAFGIKCAFLLLHNWLQDAYPAATVTGTVILSAFTTKLAIYALARGFAGTEILIYIGVATALYPLIWAQIDNNLRRVLAYALNLQQGFMLVGIGLGTELALNGAVAHAVVGVAYGMLLFMCTGAVLFRTGTAKASDLGGLYRTMPLTMLFCLIGAASISAFPLFAGFATKSLILSASLKEQHYMVWGAMLLASAGVFLTTGLRIPYFAFFAKDSGLRPKEAPWNMLLAMAVTAVLCIAFGSYPAPLYALLPYDVDYSAYSTTHVITQLQLLVFSTLAFAALTRAGLYPTALKSVNLDTDWSYRRLLPYIVGGIVETLGSAMARMSSMVNDGLRSLIIRMYHSYGPQGRIAQFWPTGSMVLWIAILLGVTLIVNFVS
jgi:multicomponent Na+:H+ antiporter subunit D